MTTPFRSIRIHYWTVSANILNPENTRQPTTEEIFVTDMSAGGLQFRSQAVHEIGEHLLMDLHIKAPFLANDTEIGIREKVVIRWAKKDDESHVYGGEFCEITEFTRSLLSNLVQRTVYMFGDEYMTAMFR